MTENGNLESLLRDARAALTAEEEAGRDIIRRSEELQQEAAASRLRRENLVGQVGALEAAVAGQANKPAVEVVEPPAPPGPSPAGPPKDSVYVNPE